MPRRNPLADITNKVKASRKSKGKFTAFQEDASLPLTMEDQVDFCLDLSPIKTNDFEDVITPKRLQFSKITYPPDSSTIAFDYRKVLNDFPAIYSDENYIDPEVVNSYIDYCAQLKEISESKPSVTFDLRLSETTKPECSSEEKLHKEDAMPMLKVKDVRFGKNWLKKVWVRKEKTALPKTSMEDIL